MVFGAKIVRATLIKIPNRITARLFSVTVIAFSTLQPFDG
jgi:hypothetical protein